MRASSTPGSTPTIARRRLFYHRVGTDRSQDRLIHEEADPGFFMSVGGTRSNEWIFIAINDHETSEYRVMPANDPEAEPKVVSPRETGLEYDIEEGGDIFFILTNADGAKDFKIVTAPAADPRRENWTDLVPHRAGAAHPGGAVVQGFPGPARAQRRLAAHRGA